MFQDTEQYDFEKLRKALVAKEFSAGLLFGDHGGLESTAQVYDANPEQLLSLARRKGINLEKYKLK